MDDVGEVARLTIEQRLVYYAYDPVQDERITYFEAVRWHFLHRRGPQTTM